jgi:signal transduction histidine kinase
MGLLKLENCEIEKNRFLNILGSMSDGVYIVNRDYDIEYVNPVVRNEFGNTDGRKCYQYLHGLDNVCPWCKIEDVLEGKKIRWEWHSKRSNKTYDLIDTPIRNPNGTISKLQIIRDITELKEAQKQKCRFVKQRVERLEKKKIARELHDTVSQILFASNLLSESIERSWENDPEKALEKIKKIRNLNNKALSEMRNILFGLISKQVKEKSIKELVEKDVDYHLKTKGIDVEIQIEGNSNYGYKIKHEVFRIFQEAVNNIIKHSKANAVKIELKLYPKVLGLMIADNGIGFNLNDKNFKRNFGINIMKQRAKNIGAHFEIESCPGSGTSIWLNYKHT